MNEMKLICGEKVNDSVYSGQCKERMEAVLKNLCMVNANDEKAAAELLYAVRFKKGMSQGQMARLEGISKQAISKRIKKSAFMSGLQKIARDQYFNMLLAERDRKWESVYRLYVSGATVSEIQKQTGVSNPGQIAKKYAIKHKLPFVQRKKGFGKVDTKTDRLIYELYMEKVPTRDITIRTGAFNPCRRARNYAKRHNLPFAPRHKQHKKRKEK